MEDYNFKIFLFFHNLKNENLYDTFLFKTLLDKPITIDDEKKEIKIKLNKANNRGGMYYETAYLLNSKDNKKMLLILTINCELDNIIHIDANETNGINIEITQMWDIDYKEIYKEERDIPNLKINEKDIQNYERLFERKRWTFINFNISSLSSKDIFSPKTLSFLIDKKNIGKNYAYNVILSEDSKIYLLSEKREKDPILFLDDSKKKEIQLIFDNINKIFNKEFNDPLFIEQPKFIAEILLKPTRQEYNKKFQEFKKIFNCYSKYWDLEKFNEKDLNLFVSYSDLTINFSYFQHKFNHIFKRVLKEYKQFKEKILKKGNLSFHEKARIICGFSRYCSHKINEENPYIPEFYMIEELPIDDPYKIACQKLESIIRDLKEYSCFFKKTLLFDNNSNELLNDWNFEEYKVKQLKMGNTVQSRYVFKDIGFKDFINLIEKLNKEREKRKKEENEDKYEDEDENESVKLQKLTFPKLSMLTLKQVKEHLLNLIPKFFFKVKYTNFSATSNRNFLLYLSTNQIYWILKV